ncbi:cell adhesion molecule CEACAM4-like [Macrotis lagotis]|uniref:cell adhesion molecule CEACAM4-like n=1 Tax=Macrotis lagotis TaxID=92651 RepID=UPI003D69A165
MKNPSGSPHSGHSLWKGLLITASILSCYFHPTSAPNDSVSVVPKPPNGTVGSSVILDIQGFSGEPFSYNWYRKITDSSNRVAAYCISTRVQIPAHIRERVFPNGSLIIPNLTCHDTDLYIVQIVDSKEEESAGKGNGFSLSEGTIAGFVTGILVGVTLIGNLIYFLFFRKTGG